MPALARGDVYALSSWKPFDLKITELAGDKYQVATNNGQEKYMLFSGIVAKREFVTKNGSRHRESDQGIGESFAVAREADRRRAAKLWAYLKTDPKDVQHVIANNTWDLKSLRRLDRRWSTSRIS